MPTVALYRCPKCRTEYRPLDAGARRFICCGVSLQRVNASSWKNSPRVEQDGRPSVVSPRPLSNAAQLPKGTELIEVIPPRETAIDAPRRWNAPQYLFNGLALFTGDCWRRQIAAISRARNT